MSIARVALGVPLHRLFDYRVPVGEILTSGDVGIRVRVRFGQRLCVGIVVGVADTSDIPAEQLKPLEAVLRDLPPLPADWFRLTDFCSAYYQVPLGEVMLSTLPAGLRRVDPPKARAARRAPKPSTAQVAPELTAEQRQVLATIEALGGGFHAYLLHGVTGSGKTEVYLRLVERALAAGRQTLLLVPEINLTPQLEARVAARFPQAGLVSLHSELTEAARTRNWRAAFDGNARLVLGTRLAVFTPMPDLGLIIVDEEHDASFKQQDGMRYSARDVAVFRAHERDIPIVLGSATPSLESWANAADTRTPARYTLLTLRERAVAAAQLPAVQRIDTRVEKLQDGFSGALLQAIEKRPRPRRAEPRLSQSPRVCPGAGVCTMRLDIALPALCRPTWCCILPTGVCAAHHCGFRMPGAEGLSRPAVTRIFSRSGAAPSASKEVLTTRFPQARILRVGPRFGQEPQTMGESAGADPCRRCRHPGRYADAGQGPRFSQADAGWRSRGRRGPVCPQTGARRSACSPS